MAQFMFVTGNSEHIDLDFLLIHIVFCIVKTYVFNILEHLIVFAVFSTSYSSELSATVVCPFPLNNVAVLFDLLYTILYNVHREYK